MRNHGWAAWGIGAALAAGPLFGQLSQYNPPGAPAAAEEAPEGDLRAISDAARWHLGPFGVDPKVELREIAYVDPGGDGEADWTATAGVGLRFFLPVGHSVLFTAWTMPEYIWWQKQDENRRWGGESGLAMLGRFGRLSMSFDLRDSDVNAFLSPEVNQRAQAKSTALDGEIAYALQRSVFLFTRGSTGRYDGEDLATGTTPELNNLDRHDDYVDLGLRWKPSRDVAIGVGGGRSRTTFDEPARDRSNEGNSTFLDLAWKPGKLEATAEVRRVSLDGLSGSELDHYSGTVGSATLGWHPRDAFGITFYGRRDLTWTVLEASPYFLDDRTGAELSLGIGHRLRLGFFGETGQRDFPGVGTDDVDSWGGTVDLTIRKLTFRLYGRETKADGIHGRSTIRELSFGVALGKFRALWS